MLRRVARLPLAIVLLVLPCGCSAVQLGYRNADTFLRWQANAYFDLEGEQSDELERRIAAFLVWHRAQALPQYVRLLEDAAARSARGVSRQDLVWGYDAIRVHVRDGLRNAARESAPLLDRLAPERVAHLERRLEEDNRKFAKDFLAGTPEDRRRRRLKRNIERLEDWVGTLSETQVDRVRAYSDRVPPTEAMRERDRRRRQAEFLAMLRARQAGRRLADWVADWEHGREPQYAAAAKVQVAEYFDLLLDIDRTLSASQRERLTRRMRGYAEDFAALQRSGPDAARGEAK